MPVRNDFAPGEFCWIDLSTHDLEAALTWYGNAFGWTHQKMETPGGGPPYAFFLQGEGVVGGIGQMTDEMKGAGVPPWWNSYVATTDCEATEAKVKELGGQVTVPTMEVPGHGKLAFFMDPQGASFAAWQATGTAGPGMLVQEPTSLSWNELMTRDTAAASEFYASLLGWDYATMPMPGPTGEVQYTMIKNAGKDAGGMMAMDGPQFEGIPPHWMVYFAVADCDAVGAKVQSSGGAVIVPTTEIMVGKFSVMRDPQGAIFSVIALSTPTC